MQLKKAYVLGESTLDNPNKILEFSKKFVVSEECIRGNLEHLKLLDLKILIGLPCLKMVL